MERARTNPVRWLFWGLVCFSILMFFSAWAGVDSLFIPPNSAAGTPLVEMPPPLLAINAGLCALPILAGFLILIGVGGMMHTVPTLGPKFVWRVGTHYLTVIGVAVLIILAAVVLFVALLVSLVLGTTGAVDPAFGLAIGVVLSGIPIVLGWYVMLIAGWALLPLSTGWERPALQWAIVGSGAFAALLIGAHVIATVLLGSAASDPSATIPTRVPWAEASSATAGFAALVVLTVVARRASRRLSARPSAHDAQPA